MKYIIFLLCGLLSANSFTSKTMKETPLGIIGDSNFGWHRDVVNNLDTFQLRVKGKDILQGAVETSKSTSVMREYKAFCRIDHICIRSVIRAHAQSPVVDFWTYVTFGHSGDDTPIYVREKLLIDVTGGDTISLDSPASPGMPVAHGQGLPMMHYRFDFSKGILVDCETFKPLKDKIGKPVPPFYTPIPKPPRWISDLKSTCKELADKESKSYAPFEQTKYTPAFPGRTGSQDQFGIYQVLPELYSDGYRLGSWRNQLYQEGCRPAHFLHPDGTRVTEDDYPDTVLASSGWIHERSKGKGWIKHTNPSAPWKDEGAKTSQGTRWRFWDSQHWSLNALCQVYYVYEDPGLEMLIEDLAEGWLWANPVVNKGTTDHIPGSARARGRATEAGCVLSWVLTGDLKRRVAKRVWDMFQLQYDDFTSKLNSHQTPLVSRKDGYSVWEHGLWVKGLAAMFATLPGEESKIHTMGTYISKWILEGFKDFNGKYYIPYVINPNGSWKNSPSKGLSVWCAPAMQLLCKFESSILNGDQFKKVQNIVSQFADKSCPRGNGWADSCKWDLY
jgi:hypothetical protein